MKQLFQIVFLQKLAAIEKKIPGVVKKFEWIIKDFSCNIGNRVEEDLENMECTQKPFGRKI